jgi:hypothetical protein
LSDYEYVLFIDEAGDDGLGSVRPSDPNGSSEWLVISGFLIRRQDEGSLDTWMDAIRKDINSTQSPVMHFKKLSATKAKRACDLLSKLECRAFVVVSNKKNMKNHKNDRAAKAGSTQWFYNFCVRLLMERVTDYCFTNSNQKFGKTTNLKVIFSQRGGHSYGQTKAYWEKLKAQSIGNTTYLKKRQIRHQILRFDLVEYLPHYMNAGLQFADVVASAFYRAVDTSGPNYDVEPAKNLLSVIAKSEGKIADYGVVLQPTPIETARLSDEQKKIFQEYGYRFLS